jgi:tRNA G18 (ribose-2'-O)-methylase SpoU
MLLDGIQSHYEIGQIFRVSEAFRIQRLVLSGVCFNIHSRKLAKAANGTQHTMPWTAARDPFDVVKKAKNYGLYIITASDASGGISLRNIDPDFPALIVVIGAHVTPDQRILDWADTVVSLRALMPPCAVAAILLHQLTC